MGNTLFLNCEVGEELIIYKIINNKYKIKLSDLKYIYISN